MNTPNPTDSSSQSSEQNEIQQSQPLNGISPEPQSVTSENTQNLNVPPVQVNETPIVQTPKPLDDMTAPWQEITSPETSQMNITPEQSTVVPPQPVQPQETSTQPVVESKANTGLAGVPLENTNPSPETNPPTELKKSGRQKILKFGILVILIILVLSSVAGVVFGAVYLKDNHVPVISGLTESVLLSDGEQFSSRMEYLFNLSAYKALTIENTPFEPDFDPQDIKPVGADKMIDEFENAEQVNFETNLTISYKLADSLRPVLGIKDPGEINEDTINKILASREGKITYSSQDSVQFNNENKARNITNLEFEVPGVNLNTGFESRVIEESIYLYLDRFPRNDYIKVEEIAGKWLLFDFQDLARDAGIDANIYNPDELYKELSNQEKEEVKKEDYDKLIQLINSSAVQNTVTSSFDEKVAETNARCYVMSINEDNIFNIYNEAGRLFDENYNEEDYKQMLNLGDYPFEKSDLTLCFAKLESYPVKVAFDFDYNEGGNNMQGKFEFKITGMKMVTPIEIPENPSTFTNEDLQELINEDIFGNSFTPLDNNFDDNDFDYEPEQITIDAFYNKENVCEYLEFYNVCNLCRNDSPECQPCLDDYNELINNGTSMSEARRETCL